MREIYNGKENKGKIYNSLENGVTKYFKLEKELELKLKDYSKYTNLTQSKIINDALKLYLNNIN